MARFYQTSSPTFVDYNEGMTKGSGVGQPTAFSLLGDLDILPKDMPRYSEILAGYDAAINEIARRAQADPKRSQTLQPDIMRLQQQMRNDLEAGELAAFVNRKKDADAAEKQIDKLYEKDPTVSVLAKERFRQGITAANYDPNTRTYEKIKPYEVQVWTPEETNKWRTTVGNAVKETTIRSIEEDEKTGRLQQIKTRGAMIGVARKRALEAIVNAVPEQALRATQQRRELLSSQTPLDDEVDETQFYTKDKEGNIIPNLNTVWGREVESLAQSITREQFKGNVFQFTDQAALANLKSNLAMGRMKYGQILQAEEDYYPKLVTLYDGTGYNGGEVNGVKVDNSLAGRKFKGGLVSHVAKVPGKAPVIVYEKVETDKRGNKTVKQYEAPMDFDMLREVLPKATFRKLQDDATSAGTWTPERKVNLPFTTDVPGVSKEWTPEKGGQAQPTPTKTGGQKIKALEATWKSKGTTYDAKTIEEAQKVPDEDYEYLLRQTNQQVEQDELIDIDEIEQQYE